MAAARALFNLAIADGIIAPGDSPAHRVAKPLRRAIFKKEGLPKLPAVI